MLKIFKVSKNEINLPVVVVGLAIVLIIYHIFSYWIPFTNNAFVATNVTPVAADVSGYITHIYVKNGQSVKQGMPLVKVYQEPYRLAYEYAKAKYEQAIERVSVIEHQTKKTLDLFHAATFDYEKAKIKFRLKNNPSVSEAVPVLEVKVLNYNLQAMEKKKDALEKQITVEDQQIVEQRKKIKALKAEMDNALVNFNLTIVRAPTDGIVDNMYISKGTPVKIRTPLFSFIDTSSWWVQANFNETDLRRIRPDDEAIVILRMYYFTKIFHGRVVNTIWAADRQHTVQRTQQQKVANENEWLLIPQRLPLQIQILDPDPNFPLQPGASAYVYIKAHSHRRNV
ncbi:MAG: HlyD family secretion protein [Gammaproteobacteria bacterium]|nr:HlyD family secretion protein [Gammaproteobacteria bacterium]